MPKVNKKILIVEDETALLNILKEKFKREGFFVYGAENGEIGLKTALKEKPSIILLDIIMPSMDGLTMLKKLREDKWGFTVPVVMLSNLGDPDQIEPLQGGGEIIYLVKSNWDLEDVVKKVRETISKK